MGIAFFCSGGCISNNMADCKVTLQAANRLANQVHLKVTVSPPPRDGTTIRYIAAAPADRRSSFTGSGLPFANERQAFTNTPNSGEVVGGGGSLKITLQGAPNAYYAGLGTLLIPPHVRVEYVDESGTHRHGAVSLVNIVGIPFRTNTYQRMRTGPEFYSVPDMFARSQPDILHASSFPENAAVASAVAANLTDFWRGRPPC